MGKHQKTHITKPLIRLIPCILFATIGDSWAATEPNSQQITGQPGNEPPIRCAGYGQLQSIFLTDWEAGMDFWTAGTHDLADPDNFHTPDWAVVGDLPDARPGSGAFVANLDIGDCETEDESGALTLDSPSILIPEGVMVPRISIDHWIATELGFDGGNLKISVNEGGFVLIPASAFEVGPYNDTLLSLADEGNTNPLASEDAFTGADEGVPVGGWGQSHINLLGIAAPGDNVRLRFDFGIDICFGVEGWYVDEVEFYSCADELLPSECGNGVIDDGEQCDDGNNFIGDGCSNTCQIESGWKCTDPLPPADILDPGFEDGTPNDFWTEASFNFDTPICDLIDCDSGSGSGPLDGDFWAWFGGVDLPEESSVSQSVTIPSTATELTFGLEVPACDSPSDYLEVLIDGNQEWLINGSSPLCGVIGYSIQSVGIGPYADGEIHSLEFHARTFANNADVSSFFVDVVSIPGVVSMCTPDTSLTLLKAVTNNNGGGALADAWTLAAAGPTNFSGSGLGVSSPAEFLPGSYVLSESDGPAGYTASAWVCDGETLDDTNTITLALGESATCTINNDDMAPSLTLVKEVNNNNGGTAKPSAWTLTATGPTSISGNGPSVSSEADFKAGSYDLSESGPGGYGASDWVCAGVTQDDADTVTLALADSVQCTITNDDVDPVIFVDGFEVKSIPEIATPQP